MDTTDTTDTTDTIPRTGVDEMYRVLSRIEKLTNRKTAPITDAVTAGRVIESVHTEAISLMAALKDVIHKR